MNEVAHVHRPGRVPTAGKALIKLAFSPIQGVLLLQGRFLLLAPDRIPAFYSDPIVLSYFSYRWLINGLQVGLKQTAWKFSFLNSEV